MTQITQISRIQTWNMKHETRNRADADCADDADSNLEQRRVMTQIAKITQMQTWNKGPGTDRDDADCADDAD